jgi:hypothetical protein
VAGKRDSENETQKRGRARPDFRARAQGLGLPALFASLPPLEAIIAGKYHCPQCGQDAAHAIVSGYYDCDCGFNYGMRARDFFEHGSREVGIG